MLSYLADGLRFLSFEGSWSLKPHEALTLNAALEWLAGDLESVARAQLAQRYFVERMSNGRIPCFRYYRMDPGLKFAGPLGSGDHFINVVQKVERRNLTAKCVLHDGVVFGLEFPKPGNFFKNADIEVVSVSCDETAFSYTDALDRAEHGIDRSD
ncbi:hypothetical protein [uncultured Roseibium sp.]|uniref:hypothetical protein n=1 Tax=uncultured Roseibium sp. TaxID=1936171 RepID=UPI0026087F87|nr:hypothetical protein [uncultured Roseibium sp.]